MTTTAAPTSAIPYAEWDAYLTAGWTRAQIAEHNTRIVHAEVAASQAAAVPQYRQWQDRTYINNTHDLVGRDSKTTWIAADGTLHTDLTGEVRTALEAKVAAHRAAPTYPTQPGRRAGESVEEWLNRMMDSEEGL